MDNLDAIRYQNPFINKVIVRIDYSQNIKNETISSQKTEEAIRASFPAKGKEQIIRFNNIEVLVNESDIKSASVANATTDEGIQREYSSLDQRNKLIISNKSLIFEVNKYTTYDDLRKTVYDILNAIIDQTRISTERIGVRYINLIYEKVRKIQKNFFSSKVASILSTITQDDNSGMHFACLRSMNQSEYGTDRFRLNFRYGLFNPNYPSPITTNDFALDFDCFSIEAMSSLNEIMDFIDNAHDSIQSLYEASITDSLRKVMNNG